MPNLPDVAAGDVGIRRRVAFARQVLGIALRQSRAPEPDSYAALLSMHDAAELFLAAGCSYRNVGRRDMNFADYFKELEAKLGVELAYRMALLRLNAARVVLKHQGIWPNRADLLDFAEVIEAFFVTNCEVVFGFPLRRASLIEYVNPEPAREALQKAESQIEGANLDEAAREVAIAFAYVVSHYGLRRQLEPSSRAWTSLGGLEREHADLRRFLEDLEKTVLGIQAHQVVAQLGVAPQEYERFRRSLPYAAISMGGTPRTATRGGQTYTVEGLREAAEFVVKVALRLSSATGEVAVRSYGV